MQTRRSINCSYSHMQARKAACFLLLQRYTQIRNNLLVNRKILVNFSNMAKTKGGLRNALETIDDIISFGHALTEVIK